MINKMTFCSNEEVTLYPIIPDPTNEGAVHMYTEERLLAEKIKVIRFQKFDTHPSLEINIDKYFRLLFHRLIPSLWLKSWFVGKLSSLQSF